MHLVKDGKPIKSKSLGNGGAHEALLKRKFKKKITGTKFDKI